MSKIIEQAKKTVQECQDQLEKIDSAQTRMEAEKHHAENRLAQLKNEIGAVLACQALNEATTVKLADLRSQKAIFEQFLEEVPFVLRELDVRKKRIGPQMREAESVMNRFDRYQTFKRQIEEGNGTFATENDLKDYAKALDLEADCKTFLAKFGKR